MGASGTDERSDREIPNVAAEQGAAECGVAAVAGILETDGPELKNMAANVCIAAADGDETVREQTRAALDALGRE